MDEERSDNSELGAFDAYELVPDFPSLFEPENSSMYPAPSPLSDDSTSTTEINMVGLLETWPNQETLQFPEDTNQKTDQPIKQGRKRRRRNESESSSSHPKPTPMWKRDPTDPNITESERKSILKAQKCRKQRDRKAENVAELQQQLIQQGVMYKGLTDENMELRQQNEILMDENTRLRDMLTAASGQFLCQAQPPPLEAPVIIVINS